MSLCCAEIIIGEGKKPAEYNVLIGQPCLPLRSSLLSPNCLQFLILTLCLHAVHLIWAPTPLRCGLVL